MAVGAVCSELVSRRKSQIGRENAGNSRRNRIGSGINAGVGHPQRALGSEGFAEGSLCTVTGSRIPFPATKSERKKSGDPRPSVEERYPSHEAYVKKVEEAAKRLVEKRLLLDADIELYVELARRRNIGVD